MKKICLISLLLISCLNATVPNFENLTGPQVKKVLNDFATSMAPTNVSPASSLGKILGVELGLLGGISKASSIDSLSSSDFSKIPHGALLIAAHVPFGLGIDAALLPIKIGDLEYKYYSYGVKWTMTDFLTKLPLDVRFKFNLTNGDISFGQSVSGTPVNVKYKNKSSTFTLTASKKILILEPFAGIGRIYSKNDLESSGTVSIFDGSVAVSERTGVKLNDTYFFIGLQLNMFLMNFAMEYSNIFDNDKISGKISFKF